MIILTIILFLSVHLLISNFIIMSTLSKSIRPIHDLNVTILEPYVVKAYFFFGDVAVARYFAVDTVKHLNSFEEILRLLDFCGGFAVGTPDTIKQL